MSDATDLVGVAVRNFGCRRDGAVIETFRAGDDVPRWVTETVDEALWRPYDDPEVAALTVGDEALGLTAAEAHDASWEPGTDEDPRLAGAPSVNESVETQLRWVYGDPVRADAALARELRRGSRARKTLIEPLSDIVDGIDR